MKSNMDLVRVSRELLVRQASYMYKLLTACPHPQLLGLCRKSLMFSQRDVENQESPYYISLRKLSSGLGSRAIC